VTSPSLSVFRSQAVRGKTADTIEDLLRHLQIYDSKVGKITSQVFFISNTHCLFWGCINRHIFNLKLYYALIWVMFSIVLYQSDTNIFYSDSKTDLKLRCDCCIKFQLFEGAQDIVKRLTAVCCMLLTQNPQPSCSCKHRFLWISPNFSISFVWIMWVE